MKRLVSASMLSLAIAVAGCGGETEEAPDITEAIPLDPVESDTAESGEGDGAGVEPANGNGATDESFAEGQAANGSDTPDLPGSGERTLPDSMERGANPPGMTKPPAGSKVQPAGGY